MDLIFNDLLFHIVKIHAPNAVRILHERAVDDVVAVIFQAVRKTNIGGRMQQNIVPARAHYVQRADNAAQHAVFVADAFFGKARNTVACFVPADDGIKIFVGRKEIAVSGVRDARGDGLGDRGRRGKVHIRHPHGDHVVALLRAAGRHGGNAGRVHSDGVFAAPIHNAGKIVFHMRLRSFPVLRSLRQKAAGFAFSPIIPLLRGTCNKNGKKDKNSM